MSDTPVYVSKVGLETMKEELRHLKSVKRKEIAERIEGAKELGDLRENADYIEAKEEYSFVEGRILELEDALNRTVVIAGEQGDTVIIGSKVRVQVGDKEKVVEVVGSREADPLKGRISNESPLGLALIGKQIGELAEVQAPAGNIHYTILAIE